MSKGYLSEDNLKKIQKLKATPFNREEFISTFTDVYNFLPDQLIQKAAELKYRDAMNKIARANMSVKGVLETPFISQELKDAYMRIDGLRKDHSEEEIAKILEEEQQQLKAAREQGKALGKISGSAYKVTTEGLVGKQEIPENGLYKEFPPTIEIDENSTASAFGETIKYVTDKARMFPLTVSDKSMATDKMKNEDEETTKQSNVTHSQESLITPQFPDKGEECSQSIDDLVRLIAQDIDQPKDDPKQQKLPTNFAHMFKNKQKEENAFTKKDIETEIVYTKSVLRKQSSMMDEEF